MARYQAALRPESVPRRGFPARSGTVPGGGVGGNSATVKGLGDGLRAPRGPRLRLRPRHPGLPPGHLGLRGVAGSLQLADPAFIGDGGSAVVCLRQSGWECPQSVRSRSAIDRGVHPSALWAAGIVFLPTSSAGAISDDCRRIRCEERRLIQWPRPKRIRSSRT